MQLQHDAVDGDRVIERATLKLMPLLGLLYLIAYIDRQNIGFAKLQMVADLGMSEAAYGLGASLFFIGYLLFEIPSNVMLAKVGARRWFARIMLSWGAVTVALGFTHSAAMLYILRFLLGVCEAGFYPGVLYYLTLWFPARIRARLVGYFMIGSALANAIAAPIGGVLLDFDGLLGLRGWQWVFVVTGMAAVLMSAVVWRRLPETPRNAPFLSEAEKNWLTDTLRTEAARVAPSTHGNPFAVLLDGRVLLMSFYFLFFPLSAYGLSYWLPTVVKGFGVSNTVNGLLNVIPWLMVGVALWWVPRHSVARNEQTWHIVVPALLGAFFLLLSVFVPGHALQFVCLCLAAAGMFAGQPVLWSLPSRFLTGARAASGLAAINSIGNLGGFIAQNVVPMIKDRTGSVIAPMLFLSACLAFGALMTFVMQAVIRRSERQAQRAGAVSADDTRRRRLNRVK
ncbi:MFS transporter [Paraburkholderia fungorum]|uniref:MFS transporter n=1 Tax=Paraburkholderia fungorum TaxID=134537 RepID=UPI000DB7993F|nr:MFS transporter [Paraburkholderia fungorum]PZR46435.1 MAG: MFS transporter [Paraburkholderia fungorum]QLD52231.1 MFS transporter [Paraburkholderia fungorum]